MKIQEAVKLANKLKCRIKNDELGYLYQCAKSISHWLFIDANNDVETYKEFDRLLSSDKWELEVDWKRNEAK